MVKNDKKRKTNELKELLEYQQQLNDLLRDIELRIYEIEGNYLEETPMGNILKGWEIDGKPLPSRPRIIDEKERLFSNSSYRVYIENKNSNSSHSNNNNNNSYGNNNNYNNNEDKNKKIEQIIQTTKKKARRSTSSSSIKKDGIYEEWENDY